MAALSSVFAARVTSLRAGAWPRASPRTNHGVVSAAVACRRRTLPSPRACASPDPLATHARGARGGRAGVRMLGPCAHRSSMIPFSEGGGAASRPPPACSRGECTVTCKASWAPGAKSPEWLDGR
eukprot:scaffold2213_cov444-Prasinococcus_capsulatus_cf.AAC.21